MSLHNIGTVYRKELMDSLRDRRTIISMVVVPILVFPLLTVGMGVLGVTMVRSAAKEIPRVMVLGGEDSPKLLDALHSFRGVQIVPSAPDAATQISEKTIREAIQIPPGFDAALDRGEKSAVTIEYYKSDLKSEFALETTQKFFDDYRREVVKEQLAARNLPPGLIDAFEVKEKNVAAEEKVGGSMFGGFVPYFIIILCMTGAMYPAMDLTAGEKERGTMETILCSPVSRTDLVLGKFFMVLSASLATALLAVTSMTISFFWAKHGMSHMVGAGEASPFSVSLDPKGVFAVIVMVLPLSVLFSAGMLAIALFAKSFREAQSYLSPLTFIVIMPAVASFLPGVELNPKTALIPIMSTSLVSKEIVAGAHPWGYIALIFASSCVYGALALAIAVKLFNREDVLFRI
ncbi:MAG TPA: ABC transporter permease [Candidatus Acidoferrales bacterium]